MSTRDRSRTAGARTRSAPLVIELGCVTTTLYVRRHKQARRTSLRISADGDGVVLVMPERNRLQDGIAIVHAHAQWIRDRLQAMPPRISFMHGALLPVHGRLLAVRHEPARRAGVREVGDALAVGGAAEDVARRVEGWLRGAARLALEQRAAAKADMLGRQPPARIVVRDTRSRWGSCSHAGVLSFSWRLVLAPPEVLDYVVAHEMAHLVHRGHGPEFWEVVARLTPEPAQGRAWLRREGSMLFRYG